MNDYRGPYPVTTAPEPRHIDFAQRPVTVWSTNRPATVTTFFLRQKGHTASNTITFRLLTENSRL